MRKEMQAEKELVVEEQRDWTSLPDDLLALIQSNLNQINDVYQFHATCKTWHSVGYPKGHLGFGSHWLLEKRRDQSTIRLFHPWACEPYCMDVPELCGAFVCFSKNGWLLMSDGYRIFFFNPFSKSKIKLPNLPLPLPRKGANLDFKGITFTSNPTSDDCTVFGINEYGGDIVEVFIISHGEESWRISINPEGSPPPSILSYCNPIFHDGKLYYLCKQGEIGVFDPDEDEFSALPPPGRLEWYFQNFLIDFNGDFLCVSVNQMGHDVQICKWDQSARSWQKVNNLGENTLFLSERTSFAKRSAGDHEKSKIYFPRFHGKYIVFFSVEDGLYRTFGNDFSSRYHVETAEQLDCCWIEPTKDDKPKVDWFGRPYLSIMEEDDEGENASNYSSGDNSTDSYSYDSNSNSDSDSSRKSVRASNYSSYDSDSNSDSDLS